MSPQSPINFTAPAALSIAISFSIVAAAIAIYRRPAIPAVSHALIAGGLLLLCLAAGGLTWHRPAAREVTVMVDLSPSTRTAGFRARDALDARIRQLLGTTPYRVQWFAEEGTDDGPAGKTLSDLPAERTRYVPPPSAAAVLLFSDGQFERPAAGSLPPTYAVVDAALDYPRDAAVNDLAARGATVAVTVRNERGPTPLALSGVVGPSPTTLPAGGSVIERAALTGAATISAQLSPGDAWPENDGMSVARAPPAQAERWLVTNGSTAAPAGWRVMTPAALPDDAAAYLAAAVVALDNVPADDIPPLQRDRLRQYVRDLGGGLLILGGDRAFAAGGYPGTALEDLSPLASHPPAPTVHWILLADGSGSMASEVAGGGTRWRRAADAVARLVPRLPPDDLVSAGHFADRVTWWFNAKPERQAAALPLPPAGVGPRGPTNLRGALEATAAVTVDGTMPTHLLLLSDADADLGDPAGIIAAFREKQMHLHLLALGEGQGLAALEQIAAATGGRSERQLDPAKWAAAVQDLMRGASPDLLERSAVRAAYGDELAVLPSRSVTDWNRAWLKSDATLLASGESKAAGTGRPALGARWNVGEGRVAALAFPPTAGELSLLASRVGRTPGDPRFRVAWTTGANLGVAIDAADGGRYLNGLAFALEFADGSGPPRVRSVPQVGPGRYELSKEAPRSPGLAAVRIEGRAVERVAVAGRYPREFDAIGNDYAVLRNLADRSGGAVIYPQMTEAIDFHWPRREAALSPYLATAGAALIGLGLIWWRSR